MARLVLTFEGRVLRELPINSSDASIGRAPDNDLVIDNLAVSNHHARVSCQDGNLFVEDLQSLNGTFLNDMRIERAALHSGNRIQIGKHTILVDATRDHQPTMDSGRRMPSPKMDETLVLDTKQRREMFQQAAAMGERAQVAPGRLRVPTLIVTSGKTDQGEYLLSNKLTVIGKSRMATVRLRGWFTPGVAAQISHRDDGYYIGSGGRVPRINGAPISGATKLKEGDKVEIGDVHFRFIYRD